MQRLIEAFFENAPDDCGPIYNERSLQLELAHWFRQNDARVEFERPVYVSKLEGTTCQSKVNLDLMVRKDGESVALELKVPLNGRHPETLYDFCNDIAFVEGVVAGRHADRGYCVFVTNDRVFWRDSGRGSSIHNLFRCAGSRLAGAIEKPTGLNKTRIVLSGSYYPADTWRSVADQRLMPDAKYLLIGVSSIEAAL